MKIDYTHKIQEIRKNLPDLPPHITDDDILEILQINHKDFWAGRNGKRGKGILTKDVDKAEFMRSRHYCFMTADMLNCFEDSGHIRKIESALLFCHEKVEIIYTPATQKLVYCVITVYRTKHSWIAIDTGIGQVIGYHRGVFHTGIKLSDEILRIIDRSIAHWWRLDQDNELHTPEVLSDGSLGLYTITR